MPKIRNTALFFLGIPLKTHMSFLFISPHFSFCSSFFTSLSSPAPDLYVLYNPEGFPGSSAGKESTCNAQDPGLIPGLGRSIGEGIGFLLQYSWASLVAQMVKNLPATQEPEFDLWVGKVPGRVHGNPLQDCCLEKPHGQRSLAGYSPWGHKVLDMTE